MSSQKPSHLTHTGGMENLHYYTGRVRAFWKDKIFFSDQRNVAVVNIQDLYLYGKKASMEDVSCLEKLVTDIEWDEVPELHSYVSEYPGEVPHSWPYKLSGKALWQAKCAWLGSMPDSIGGDYQNNIVYMPVSYYTGKIIRCFQDKILFGDLRNNVMVNIHDFYVHGERSNKKMMKNFDDTIDFLVHAYITKLKVLAGASSKIIGPEPNLPTWPKQHYTSDMWVAKFAWHGEMPVTVKEQVRRFHMVHMNQWETVGHIPWIRGNQFHGYQNRESECVSQREKSFTRTDDEETNSSNITVDSPIIPVEQEEGIMKGSLLLANHHQGLMTSFVDVIAFTKENFYINGEKFRSHMSLSDFFACRKIPLTAWVVPLGKPKIIFHINVLWLAVCVWYGHAPRDLENIKKQHGNGKLAGKLAETRNADTTKRFTHFMGNITSLSFASGVLKSRVSSRLTVKISFKRRSLYMYGYKFHSSCRLLDKQQILESFTWSILAYPTSSENHIANLHYHAIAVWQYQYQPYIMMNLFQIISETINSNVDGDSSKSNIKDYSPGSEELVQHMSGWIVRVSEHFGILQSGSNQAEATFLVFDRSVLFVDGELLPKQVNLILVDRHRQCNVYAKPIPGKVVQGFPVTMEATLVWIGKKPLLFDTPPRELSPDRNEKNPPIKNESYDTNERYPLVMHEEQTKMKKVDIKTLGKKTSYDENMEGPFNELHAVEGIIAGSVLMTNDHQGLMICFNSIVAFSIQNLYIDGEKFNKAHTSLSEFFDKKKILRAWVVPLKKPKVLFNCYIVCEAICVWSGQEPADLKILETEHRQEISLDKAGNTEKFVFPEVVFTYFLGNIIRLSVSTGLITCETPRGNVTVAFWNKSLFLNGAWIHRGSDLQNYSTILTMSAWSVLAYSIAPKEVLGETVKYCAVAVWNCTDHHIIGRELLLITSFKTQDLAYDILPIDIQKEITRGNMIVEEAETDSVGKLMCGWIVFAKDYVGVVECISERLQEKTYVLFYNTALWIDGQTLGMDRSLHSVDRSLQCTLCACSPHKSEFDGYKISYIASVVWMGKKPLGIFVGHNLKPLRFELKLKTASHVEEVNKKLEKVSLLDDSEVTVTQMPQMESEDEEIQEKLENENEEPVQKYRGKHITGMIIQKHKSGGVAQWHSIQLQGDIYIGFYRKNIYIDLSPMTRRTKLSDIACRPCNFYVVPVRHYDVSEHIVSLLATCGWIGSKPSHIPQPGTQESASIDLSSVHVSCFESQRDDDKSQNALSAVVPQQRSCLKIVQNINEPFESSLQKSSLAQKTYVKPAQPGAVPKDKSLQIVDINGYSSVQNGYNYQIAKSLVYDKTVVGSHNSTSSDLLSHHENSNCMWEEGLTETHLRGTIIELHSNVGRLKGADGSQHYFSRDHCYLYGVSLRNVELWHVLIHGEAVLYTLSENLLGTMKVQGVWVGALKVGDVQKTAAYIYEWCKKNLVPDGAREILVHQLEVS